MIIFCLGKSFKIILRHGADKWSKYFMRSFQHIATLIRVKRMSHPSVLSQTDLSTLLGYKNGQFISNVERGLCNVPLKMMSRIAEILNISETEIKTAILKDHAQTLDNFFNTQNSTVNKTKKQLKDEVLFNSEAS